MAKKNTIEIPITDCDIEMFKDLVDNGEEFAWSFTTDTGIDISVKFVQEEEEEYE